MNIDFHYYLTYFLAERAGFDRNLKGGETEAEIIAYASQYVDDNDERQVMDVLEGKVTEVENGEMKGASPLQLEIERCRNFPWAVRIRETQNFFRPIMTQTATRKSLLSIFQRDVFVPFHFLPGDLEKIPDIRGRKNSDSTTANSRNAVALLKDALESGDLYRIGIALHTFADTWSHQNFSGYRDDWNAVRDSIVPDIGHAEVFTKPDVISERWVDARLKEAEREIDNRDRARKAAKEIFLWLSKYRNPVAAWEDIQAELDRLIQAKDSDERVEMIKGMYPGKNLGYSESVETTWIYRALEYDSEKREVMAKDGFWDSHWCHFQLAAQRHLAMVAYILTGSIKSISV